MQDNMKYDLFKRENNQFDERLYLPFSENQTILHPKSAI